MRLRTTLAVIGLVAAMGMMTGCKSWCRKTYPCDHIEDPEQTPPEGEGPWVKRGVIRAERDGVIVAFASVDPGNPKAQHWLVRGGVEFPFANSGPFSLEEDWITFFSLDVDDLTPEQLCAHFGPMLMSNPPSPAPSVTTMWSEYSLPQPCGE